VSRQVSSILWGRIFPFIHWLPRVNRDSLRDDLIAGLTNAVIVLPQGVAFALIAGMPPEYGLYTAIVPAIIAALFGSSFHLISGPTTAISIVVFSTVSPHATPGSAQFIELVLTMTFIAGLIQAVLGIVRLGALVNFISHSVVVGFTAGAAILIGTSQMKNFFGVKLPQGESFLNTWIDLIRLLPHLNPLVLLIAATTLGVALAMRIYKPRWPGMLIAMIIGSLLAALFDAEMHGIKLVGSLPRSLPPLSMPDFSIHGLRLMAPGALAVAMLGLVEAVSIARSVATLSHQRINGNQEFIGQGLSNVIGSFFSCYASSGSFTRTGLNYRAGAKTPLSAIFAALSLALILVLVAPLAAYLPIPAMAGILLLVAFNLIDFHHIKIILQTSRSDAAVLVTTFLATLFVELEFAIYVGVLLSLVLYLNRTAHPTVLTRVPDPSQPKRKFTSNPTLPECPQLKVIRIDGSLFFGAVDHVQDILHGYAENHPEQKHLLVVGNGINFVDVAGAEMLTHEAERRQALGGGMYLCTVKEGACAPLRSGGYLRRLGAENLFDSKSVALRTIFDKLDKDICRRCDKRIFNECQSIEKLP
jgi:SulP family sulfate permease